MISSRGISVSLFTSDTSDEEDSSINVTKRGEDFNVLLQKSGRTLILTDQVFLLNFLSALNFPV